MPCVSISEDMKSSRFDSFFVFSVAFSSESFLISAWACCVIACICCCAPCSACFSCATCGSCDSSASICWICGGSIAFSRRATRLPTSPGQSAMSAKMSPMRGAVCGPIASMNSLISLAASTRRVSYDGPVVTTTS